MRYFTLLFLSFLFLACGDATPEATETADRVDEAASEIATEPVTAETEAATFLDTTLDAVKAAGGDLTALAPSAAANNVNGWITKLSRLDGTDAIVGDLADLKKEFLLAENGTDINGANVSIILGSLAKNTREVSHWGPGLEALADALQAASTKLAGK